MRRHSDHVFKYIIKPAMDEMGIDAYRSDHSHGIGKISDQMFQSILNEDLCIAVLTFTNPNVYYELAIAQSAARPVIIRDENPRRGVDLTEFAERQNLRMPAMGTAKGDLSAEGMWLSVSYQMCGTKPRAVSG